MLCSCRGINFIIHQSQQPICMSRVVKKKKKFVKILLSGLLFQCSSQGHQCWLRKRFNSWGSVFVEILFLSFYKKWLWSENLTLSQRQTSPNISSHAIWWTYHICHVEYLTPLKNWIAILIKKTYFVFASHILSQLSLLRFEGLLHYWDFHFLNCLENWLG